MERPGNAEVKADQLDAVFAALSDPTRRAILARLQSGEASVAELAEPFAMTQPAISKHLRVLEAAGLVTREQDAQRRPRRLDARPLAVAASWMAGYREFWGKSPQTKTEAQPELKAEKKKGKKNKHKHKKH
jgi:DNA-binding transcriptional ArsR family regulator